MAFLFGDMILYLGLILVLTFLIKPVGTYISRVFEGKVKFLSFLESAIYRLCGIHAGKEMGWRAYALSMLLFNVLGILALFFMLLLQQFLPLNPQGLSSFSWDLALNTAVSFVTNTNWQAYSGESAASYFSQMMGFAVQNFLSAATGICIAVALVRGIARESSQTIGNFWADLTRCTLYLLLPVSFVFAVFLLSQGVIQNFDGYVSYRLIDSGAASVLPMGPVASQEAIKEYGTNGGGFFNANSAHPFENPTPLSNAAEIFMILILPFSLVYTYGHMVKDTKQGWALYSVMLSLFVLLLLAGYIAESYGNPLLAGKGISGDYMEGKEARFSVGESVLFAAATTATSCGAVNTMHDSLTPIGGMVPLVFILLGEIIPGGVGSGLYTILPYVIIGVFVAGLMVGRSPEYLGKKIEAMDMKAAVLIVLTPSILVLILSGMALVLPEGVSSISNSGPHGLSEVLYAFASMSNNNGSAFAGLNANTLFYNLAGALAMFLGRFVPAIAALALAGSMAKKRRFHSKDVLPTHSVVFVIWLIGVILLLDTISFLPALALGPVIEHLIMLKGGVF
jgi:potassium-transporting ATPase potassium-binding subunit